MSKSEESAEEKFADSIYECIECGKTVIVHRNLFKPTKHKDRVYCPCLPQGVPMVKRENEDESDGEDDELSAGLTALGEVMARWEATPETTPGSCTVYCRDCGFEKTFWDQGNLDAKLRAERSKSGHLNKGCANVEVVDRS